MFLAPSRLTLPDQNLVCKGAFQHLCGAPHPLSLHHFSQHPPGCCIAGPSRNRYAIVSISSAKNTAHTSCVISTFRRVCVCTAVAAVPATAPAPGPEPGSIVSANAYMLMYCRRGWRYLGTLASSVCSLPDGCVPKQPIRGYTQDSGVIDRHCLQALPVVPLPHARAADSIPSGSVYCTNAKGEGLQMHPGSLWPETLHCPFDGCRWGGVGCVCVFASLGSSLVTGGWQTITCAAVCTERISKLGRV